MDVYKAQRPDRSEAHYVLVGRITSFVAMIIALILARPFLGGLESAFQAVQEYTGYIAPGIFVVFLLGFFWKRTNSAGALSVLLSSLLISIVLGVVAGGIPFVIRIALVFLACAAIGVIVSEATGANRATPERVVDLSEVNFATSAAFNLSAVLILAILVGIYIVF